MQTFRSAPVPLRRCARAFLPVCSLLVFWLCTAAAAGAATPASAKTHTVTLGATRKVPYTPPDATAADKTVPAEDALTLKVRPLTVDGRQKEWTTGEAHDVTDRSFTVRRALRLNDALPGESTAHWVWQPGPWLMVDRTTGRVTALHLPEFDPILSQVAWYRNYAAYCGIGTTAKGGVFAIVAQVGSRKAVVQKQLAKWPQADHKGPLCETPAWQRQPMRVTVQLAGGEPMIFDVVGTSSLIEDGDDEP